MKVENKYQSEIQNMVKLCDSDGTLNSSAVGWSRKPRHVCNLSGNPLRKKKWNYWCITGKSSMISVTIAHVDYASLAFVYLLEYDSKNFAEKTVNVFFPGSNNFLMPEKVHESVYFLHRQMNLEFLAVSEGYKLKVFIPSFKGEVLEAELHIKDSGNESLNVVIPWSKNKFQFTSKQNCLPVSGYVSWGKSRYNYKPETTFACLDFGRGIWPYQSSWNWASFSGISAGSTVGLNAGAKWTDGTGLNENAISLNGKICKIFDDIIFEYDDTNFMKPWKIYTTGSDAVDLLFKPFFQRSARSNFLLIKSSVNQLYGKYSGYIHHGKRKLKIHNLTGWAEEHFARW